MKKAKGTMTVTLPDGRSMDVPKGLTGHKLEAHVREQLQKEQAAAAQAAEAKAQELTSLQQTRIELNQLQGQVSESMKVIEELRAQNERLRQASPDAAAGAMALMAATRDAERLRRELMSDLGAASEWRSAFSEDIREVASEVRKKNAVADSEFEERRRANRILFDDIRENQGMERQHPDLVAPVVITSEETDG